MLHDCHVPAAFHVMGALRHGPRMLYFSVALDFRSRQGRVAPSPPSFMLTDVLRLLITVDLERYFSRSEHVPDWVGGVLQW